MEKGKNKQIRTDKKQTFFFPKEQPPVSVEADSPQEAEQHVIRNKSK